MTAERGDGALTMPREVQALVVRQWLNDWEQVRFAEAEHRRRPEPTFYVFSLPARSLRRLSGIYRRTANQRRVADLGIQRRHDEDRSTEIARFVKGGYPWSAVTDEPTARERFPNLMMPGWLPTAIVANILAPDTERNKGRLAKQDALQVSQSSNGAATIKLPAAARAPDWNPVVRPIEIIDGQHRLWAFDHIDEVAGEYDLPVVAFYGLDIAWQAYLFWTINIKPKRINASLAFDLYPLLRTQDWLESFEGPAIYREARAQELTEALWSYPESPWHRRINMLGEPGGGAVTQASFIRSLLASFVKRWEGRRVSIGGLFGAELSAVGDVLPWSRVQQASYLIALWQAVEEAIASCQEEWALALRQLAARDLSGREDGHDPAFISKYSLFSTDQGVRGVLHVTNDLSYMLAQNLRLREWATNGADVGTDEDRIRNALGSLPKTIRDFLSSIARDLVRFDWRTSATPDLREENRLRQAAFRGSGGYKELRRQLLMVLETSADPRISRAASRAVDALGYRSA